MSTLGAFMNGIDTMCKAELVTLCEKHSVSTAGTVAQLRYVLKKHFEIHGVPDRDEKPPLAKKHTPDPLSAAVPMPTPPPTPSASGVVPASPSSGPKCTLGAACPELHSFKHRVDFAHDGGFRQNPIKCRDGSSCPKLKDKEHLLKYAHEDDASKVCKDGSACPFAHVLDHRLKFEHAGLRAQPFPCRDGASCGQLLDRGHLYKYAHDIPMPIASAAPSPTAAPPTPVSLAVPAVVPTPPTPTLVTAASIPTLVPSPGVLAHSPTFTTTVASATTSAVGISGKTLADFPLENAPETLLVEISKDSEEFWELEEKFNANLQGSNEDYVGNRIKAGKKPLRFILVGAEKVVNPVLEARFELKKNELCAIRDAKEVRERTSFHGTHPKNLKSLLHYSLLRFKHPLNPCKAQVDDGYFGTNKKGIYVSRYADYTLKYSNRVCALDAGDEVKTIMFRTLPGRSKHIEKLVGPIDPTPGYDSHSSPTFLEWYLFDEAQVCPVYVLKVKAVEDTRTAADDQ